MCCSVASLVSFCCSGCCRLKPVNTPIPYHFIIGSSTSTGCISRCVRRPIKIERQHWIPHCNHSHVRYKQAPASTATEICKRCCSCECCGDASNFFRTPAMLDVVNLRRYKCHTDDCLRQAYYNFAALGRGKAKFCSTHKLPEMLNVRHRLCESEGCGTTPTYSFAGGRPRYSDAISLINA